MSVKELQKRMTYLKERGIETSHRLYKEINSTNFWRLAKALQ